MVRRSHCLMMALSLIVPTWAAAQTVARDDLVGLWDGEVKDTGVRHGARIQMWLWSDGMFVFDEERSGQWYTHNSGRWRLSGDTLWWGGDYRYGNDGLYERSRLPPDKTLDTLDMPYLPTNDTLFWTASLAQRRVGKPMWRQLGPYWQLSAYQISLKNRRLTLVRLYTQPDTAPFEDWHPTKVVFQYKYKANEPASRLSGAPAPTSRAAPKK